MKEKNQNRNIIFAIIGIVILAVIIGILIVVNKGSNYERYLGQNEYEKAFEVAKNDEEKRIVLAHNAIAYLVTNYVKQGDSDVVSVRDAWYDDDRNIVLDCKSTMLSASIKYNDFYYAYYAYNKTNNDYSLVCIATGKVPFDKSQISLADEYKVNGANISNATKELANEVLKAKLPEKLESIMNSNNRIIQINTSFGTGLNNNEKVSLIKIDESNDNKNSIQKKSSDSSNSNIDNKSWQGVLNSQELKKLTTDYINNTSHLYFEVIPNYVEIGNYISYLKDNVKEDNQVLIKLQDEYNKIQFDKKSKLENDIFCCYASNINSKEFDITNIKINDLWKFGYDVDVENINSERGFIFNGDYTHRDENYSNKLAVFKFFMPNYKDSSGIFTLSNSAYKGFNSDEKGTLEYKNLNYEKIDKEIFTTIYANNKEFFDFWKEFDSIVSSWKEN